MSKRSVRQDGAESNLPVTVTRRFNDVAIGQRLDGYLNATAMCRANGKLWGHYWATDTAQEFAAELSGSIGIPIDLLVSSITTGPNAGRGTWVHPQIGYHLAQWCSAKFAVQVTEWIHDIKTKGYATAPGVDLDHELIRRTDGVTRSTIHKVTNLERKVAELTEMVEKLNAGVTTLTLGADARVAALDLVSVRQLMDDARARSKGRSSLNHRVRNALLSLALRENVKGVRRCPHSNHWLFPIDFARDWMKATGNAWVDAHNASLEPQGDLFAAPPAKKKRKAAIAKPANDPHPTAANGNSRKKRGAA